MIVNEEEYLAHYGTLHKSGRYPWGSGGDDENPRSMTFLDTYEEYRRKGLTESQIAEALDVSTTELRAKRTIAKNAKKLAQISRAQSLKDKGNANTAIGKIMGINESSVRALLAPGAKDKADVITNIASVIKTHVDSKKFIDVGSGVEVHLGISQVRLGNAVEILKQQGYNVHLVKVPQLGVQHETEMKVLTPPGVTQKEAWLNRFNIQQIPAFSQDGGHTFGRVDHPPISIHPDRVAVSYKEDGGGKADGMIYVRPGVEDISLGLNRYAQVRVMVGGTHYLKGMAMYKDGLPKGTDLVFNTSKSSTGNKLDAMKPIGPDKDYPFGSIVRQILSDPGTPNERNTSSMNLVHEQGDWAKWNRNLSSQFLSKQDPKVAKEQLDMTFARHKTELSEITALTNPTIKKKLLETFADSADSSAVHLKAAALPRSNWHAILPIDSMPPTQIYAPNYRDGTHVALIRYPHGGTFEIPQLIVNNKNPEAKKLLGDARDAVGIHYSVAERLSGADFDGDTVLVIPNDAGKVKYSPALDGLKNFDPKSKYAPFDGMRTIDGGTYNAATKKVEFEKGVLASGVRKGHEMGSISNLITDMTLQGAPASEVVRAIRHSMVVIDAEKHHLDFKQSAIDNGIAKLKTDYQGGPRAGAATLISRKGSAVVYLPDRKLRPQNLGGPIDPLTGRKVYVDTGAVRRLKDGSIIPKRVRVNKLAETTDANTLSSGTPMEMLYAEHSNKLKALANEARLAAFKTPRLIYSPSAKKTYASEVASLNAKLTLVKRNRPLERAAQIIAGGQVRAKQAANPNLERDSLRKIKFEELEKARQRTGAKSKDIKITPEEWNAIQAGAISDSKLTEILAKADLEIVRGFATPRHVDVMTNLKVSRAKAMLAEGYTWADVADSIGVSVSTLDRALHK